MSVVTQNLQVHVHRCCLLEIRLQRVVANCVYRLLQLECVLRYVFLYYSFYNEHTPSRLYNPIT